MCHKHIAIELAPSNNWNHHVSSNSKACILEIFTKRKYIISNMNS